MKSLSVRVGVMILAVMLPLLTIFGVVAYSIGEQELTAAFDTRLRVNAEALATLTEVENGDHYDIEFDPRQMPQFADKEAPDLFAIIKPTGKSLFKSDQFVSIPDWMLEEQSGAFRDFSLDKTVYRGYLFSTFARVENGEFLPTAPIRVLFASSRQPLDEALSRLLARMAVFLMGTVLFASILASVVARFAIAPLRLFADRLDGITPSDLGESMETSSMPLELQRPTAAFNRLAIRLKEAFERERSFSADAAHELRTPIGSMLVSIQAARLYERDAGADADLLEDLEEETARLRCLCEELLTLNAGEESSGETMSGEELAGSIQATVDGMRVLVERGNGVLTMELDEGLEGVPLVRCASETPHHILTNLIGNALSYGRAGGEIAVRVGVCDDYIEVSCHDDGPGVSKELGDQVFERFVRGDASRSHYSGGAGLGLTISRQLARRSGGELTLDRSVETGARFVWRVEKVGDTV